MKLFVQAVTVLGFVAVLVAAQTNPTTTTDVSTTSDPKTTTTTDKPITTTTPASTTVTPEPSSSTTAVPSTTTPKPTPTTLAPTTTSAPTPAPKPSEPTLGNYTLADEKGDLCVVAEMKVVVTQNATRVPLVNGSVSVDSSECSAKRVELWINFDEGNQLQLVFGLANDSKQYFVKEISVHAGSIIADRSDLQQFPTPAAKYFKCAAKSEVDLAENSAKIIFEDLKFEAFRATPSKSASFQGAQFECVSDYHSDVVIIAIGCALALLVVIILVAYLIARRRNRQRGYQSV